MVDYDTGQYVYYSDGQKLENIERRLLVAAYIRVRRMQSISPKTFVALIKQYDDMRWQYADEIGNTEMGYALRGFDGTEQSVMDALELLTQSDYETIAAIAKTVEAGFRRARREARENDRP